MSGKMKVLYLSPLALMILQACGSGGDNDVTPVANTAPQIQQFQASVSGSQTSTTTNGDSVVLTVQANDAENDPLSYSYFYLDAANNWVPLTGSTATLNIIANDMFGFRVQVSDGQANSSHDIVFNSLLNTEQVAEIFTAQSGMLTSQISDYLGVVPLRRGSGIVGLTEQAAENYRAVGPLGTANSLFQVADINKKNISAKITALHSLLEDGVFQPLALSSSGSGPVSGGGGNVIFDGQHPSETSVAPIMQQLTVNYDLATTEVSVSSVGTGFHTVGAESVMCRYAETNYPLGAEFKAIAENLGSRQEQWRIDQSFIEQHFASNIGAEDALVELTDCTATHETGGANLLQGSIQIEFVTTNSDSTGPVISGAFHFPDNTEYTTQSGVAKPVMSVVGSFTPSFSEAVSEESLVISYDNGNSFTPMAKVSDSYEVNTLYLANDVANIMVKVDAKDVFGNATSQTFEQPIALVNFDTTDKGTFDGSTQTVIQAYKVDENSVFYAAQFGQDAGNAQVRIVPSAVTVSIEGESVATKKELFVSGIPAQYQAMDVINLPTTLGQHLFEDATYLDKAAENLTGLVVDFYASHTFTLNVEAEQLTGAITINTAERHDGKLRDGQSISAAAAYVNQLGQSVIGTTSFAASLNGSTFNLDNTIPVGTSGELVISYVRAEDNKVIGSITETLYANTAPTCSYIGAALSFTGGAANYPIPVADIQCADAENDAVNLMDLTIPLTSKTAGTYTHHVMAGDGRSQTLVPVQYTVVAANTAPTIVNVGSFDGTESQYNVAYAPANINLTAPTCQDDNAGDTLSVNIYKNGSLERSVSSAASFAVNYAQNSSPFLDTYTARCYDQHSESSAAAKIIGIYETF